MSKAHHCEASRTLPSRILFVDRSRKIDDGRANAVNAHSQIRVPSYCVINDGPAALYMDTKKEDVLVQLGRTMAVSPQQFSTNSQTMHASVLTSTG